MKKEAQMAPFFSWGVKNDGGAFLKETNSLPYLP